MYLFVNPRGARHMIFDSFSDLLRLSYKDCSYRFSILAVGNPGKYDMVLDHTTESVSKKTYVKAYIVQNLKNSDSFVSDSDGTYPSVFVQSYSSMPTGKKFDVLSLLNPEILINGYLPTSVDPHCLILNDFKELTKILDAFFSPTPIQTPTASVPTASVPTASVPTACSCCNFSEAMADVDISQTSTAPAKD